MFQVGWDRREQQLVLLRPRTLPQMEEEMTKYKQDIKYGIGWSDTHQRTMPHRMGVEHFVDRWSVPGEFIETYLFSKDSLIDYCFHYTLIKSAKFHSGFKHLK
jgi:hypothetical protein